MTSTLLRQGVRLRQNGGFGGGVVSTPSPLGGLGREQVPSKNPLKPVPFSGLLPAQRNPGSLSSPVRETPKGAGGVEGTNIITKRSQRLGRENGSFWPRHLATKPLFVGTG